MTKQSASNLDRARNVAVICGAVLASLGILASAIIATHNYFGKTSVVERLREDLDRTQEKVSCLEKYIRNYQRVRTKRNETYGEYINAKVNILAKKVDHPFPTQEMNDKELAKDFGQHGQSIAYHRESKILQERYEGECS